MSIALPRTLFATRRARTVVYTGTVVGVAVAAGLLTNAQPTGLTGSDMFWSAAVVAVLAAFGATARRWTWFLPAGVGALLAGDGLALALAAVAVAIAFVSVLRDTRTRARGALVTGLGGIVLLRAGPLGFHGLTAIITVAAILPAVVSGYQHAGRRARARARRCAIAAGAVMGLMVVGAAIGVLSVQGELAGGARGIDQGLTAARSADDDLAAEQLDAAALSLTSAEGTLDSWLVAPARSLPIVGPNIDAVGSLSAEAGRVAGVSALAAETADIDALHFVGGRLDPAAVSAMQQPLDRVRTALASMDDEVLTDRSPWLVNMVSGRLDRLDEQIDQAIPEAENAMTVLSVAPRMLGTDGPQRYLVTFTTPVEARGRIGFPGNYAEIVVDDGKLSMPVFGRIAELERAGSNRELGLPLDLVARYSRFDVANTWRNLTMTPDFPSFALAAEQLYPQSGGRDIDGVLTVDPAGLAAFMSFTGPVQVPGLPDPITAENAEQFLLSDQYSIYANDNDQRLDVLDSIARTTFERLTSGDLPGPRRLSGVLDPMVDGGHIMFASTDASTFLSLQSLDISGTIWPPEEGADSVLVTTTNAAANKLDLFLHRREQYDVQWDPETGQATATLRLTLENRADPAAPYPDYVMGNAVGLPRGTNRSYLSIYSPFVLDAARIGGQPAGLQSEVELGHNVYSTFVDIPPGATVEIELDLTGTIDGRVYDLTLPVQPFGTTDEASVSVEVAGGSARSRQAEVDGGVATWSGTLDETREISVSAPRG